MRKHIGAFALAAIIVVAMLFVSTQKQTRFHNGQILMPDYVHSDTLIVTDAEWLNKHYDSAMTDGAIMELMNHSTGKFQR